MSVAEAEVLAELCEPAAAPYPVAIERIGECADPESIDHEILDVPALGHGAGRNRRGGVHEHHLEQEQGEDRGIEISISQASEEETLVAEDPHRVSEDGDRGFPVEELQALSQCGLPANGCRAAGVSAEHQRKADSPESQRVGKECRSRWS